MPAPTAMARDPQQAVLEEAATDAWLYFYPLLLMQATRASEPQLELGVWKHSGSVRRHDDRKVIRPNVDTISSHAWLDLSGGPILLETPDTEGLYHVVQAVDEWSLTFATVGSRTIGNGPGRFLFVPPGLDANAGATPWPRDATLVRAPTQGVWLLMRIQSDDSEEEARTRALQTRFRLTALEERAPDGPMPLPPAAATGLAEGTPPPQVILNLDPRSYFEWASRLWGAPGFWVPNLDDALVDRVELLGLRPGSALEWDALDPGQRAALSAAPKGALRKLAGVAAKEGGVNVDGWYYLKDNWYRVQDHRVFVKQPTHYPLRAGLALEALGFLPLQEATYLSAGAARVGGEVLSGADGRSYTIRFPEGHLPAVEAFWSLTVYEGQGWLVDNPIHRHNLGSRDELRRDADGAVTLHLSATNPHGADSGDTSNWLPIPDGEFSVSFRAYWPSEPIVHEGDGWRMVPVIAAD